MLTAERVLQLQCDLYVEARHGFHLGHQESVERSVRVMSATLRTLSGGNNSITLSIDHADRILIRPSDLDRSPVDIEPDPTSAKGRKCHCGAAPAPDYDAPDCVPICESCLQDYMVGTPQEHATLRALWQN